MTGWYPRTVEVIDHGFGGSRNGETIDGAVIHHTANGGGASALGYVANQNSRNSHPTYLIQRDGDVYGIVHPDRRPYSTAGHPDEQAISFEVDNESGAPNWGISDPSIESIAQVIAYHYRHSPRWGRGIARNIVGKVQREFFVAWHSQYVATACPGPDMISKLDRIIARALEIANPTPTTPPIDPNTSVKVGSVVGVKSAFGVYSSAALALAGGAAKTTYPAGNYTVYKVARGCVNLTRVAGKPGGWAEIARIGLTDPTPTPEPEPEPDPEPEPEPDPDPEEPPVDPTDPLPELPDPLPDGDENANPDAPLSGLLAGHPIARKRAYYAYASAALVLSFGPDFITAGILTSGQVTGLTAGLTIASSILLKVGVAFGFVAASNVEK